MEVLCIMEFKISDKKKKDVFVSIFNLLKYSSRQMNVIITPDMFHMQGMDKSHVCLFDLKLSPAWFDSYQVTSPKEICFDAFMFYSIISIKNEDQTFIFYIEEDNNESMMIEVINEAKSNKNDYNKYFTLPLMEYDYQQLNIPTTDYDADISLPSKNLTDSLSQLINFGQDVTIHCTNECVDFITKGDSANMRVNIPIDDLTGYSIVEDQEINVSYNLTFVSKMCVTNKLSTEVELYISNEFPMKISYNLGEAQSTLNFFIAPKLID